MIYSVQTIAHQPLIMIQIKVNIISDYLGNIASKGHLYCESITENIQNNNAILIIRFCFMDIRVLDCSKKSEMYIITHKTNISYLLFA